MQIIKKIFLFILICLINSTIVAQVKSIGTPFIRNYTRANYQAGSQTWDIEQGNNGMMYFANNNGLLEYDGHNWRVYPMPNNSIIRSIRNGNDSIMYAGGYNEFGYYKIGKMGGAKYYSLIDLLPEEQRNFDDVWNIFIHPDGVIFQTYTQIMFYKNGEISILPAPSSFHFSFLVNNEYYVNDLENGLMRYALGKLHPLIGLEPLIGKEIWGVISMGKSLLIATASEGIYLYDGNLLTLWNNQSSDFLKKNQIYSNFRLNDSLIAFGTIQNGIFMCDNNGGPVQLVNMEDGLQNNTVLCIGQDEIGNLWLGTDLGIDYVMINSPLSQLSFNYGLSTGYAVIEFKGNLYLGTNQGLYATTIESIEKTGFANKKLDLIEATRGQVWSLLNIDDQLFCGHNNGTFLIEGKTAKKISDVQGGWSYLKVPDNPLKIIGGTYSGLSLYQNQSNNWKYSKQVKGFGESARKIAFDQDGSLWMAHGYKGVFNLHFNSSYDSIEKIDFYNSQNSNLSSSDISLTKIGQQVIFNNLHSVYRFSSDKNNFLPDEKLNHYLKGYDIRSINQDRYGNIWYFKDERSGVLRILEDGKYSDISLPFQQIKDKFVKGFEFVYPIDDQNVFFGIENGFIHYDPSISKNYAYQFRTYLRSMHTYNPDSIYEFKGITNEIVLEYENNDIEFIFSANDFENPEQIMYSTYMEGYDEEWSTWQLRSTRDFTNLNEGDYVFKVKARNVYGTISEEVSIAFKVSPPFHRSALAYLMYGIGVLILLIFFGWILKRRFERGKLRSQKQHQEAFRRKEEKLQKEALETEQQLIRMRNEKLREEMKLKDKELANATMQTLHKNEMLITLRDELKKLVAHSDDEAHKHEVKHLVRRINKEIDNENQWKIFETQFENVHEEFLKRVKQDYPNLTPRELKLCAYLRMNISSKEMSVLMNISTRGVEISRYRLRKKLDLSRETNLTDFIMSF